MSSFRDKPHVAPFVGPSWPAAAAWLAAALVGQATVVHAMAIRGVVPSLVLVVVVWYAVRVDPLRAAAYGLAAGICEDALSGNSGCAWTAATIASAVLASLLSRGFFADSIPLAAAIASLATLLRALVFWTVMSLQGYPGGLGAMHARDAAAAAVMNVAVIVAAMLAVRRFEARA